MTTKTLDFTTYPAADPTTPPAGWLQPAGSNSASLSNRSGSIQWSAKVIQSIWIDSTIAQGTWISSTVKLGEININSAGACIIDANGDGWMITVANTNTISLRAVLNSQIVLTVLQSFSQVIATNGLLMLRRNTLTGELQTYYNGTQLDVGGIGYLGGTTPNARYCGCVSRFGYLKSVTSEFTPDQTVVSINGGVPFTASQTSGAASLTGFTGIVTSITSNLTGLSFSGIGGTATDPTYTKSVPIDGAVYPKRGSTATLTFSKGAETASGTILINKDADQTTVIVASPINDDITCLFGAIFATTGRSAANGDEVYHTVPAGMSDLLINPDGTMEVTNAGTFDCWVWTSATGVNYYYSVTITENGVVINGGLTSSGLTSSGLTRVGLTSSGL